MSCRAVFLDRDGVLNKLLVKEGRPYPPAGREELEILPGVDQACARLKEAGFLLIVVTNQPDVARGTLKKETVEDINSALCERLELDGVYVCYHDDGDRCVCRKPKPGLLFKASRDWQIDLSSSIMIGDRWRDVEAGLNAGCRTMFIDYGYQEELRRPPHRSVGSLAEAARYILDHDEGKHENH